ISFQLSARGHLSTWPAFGSQQTVVGHHKPCCAPEEGQPGNKRALLPTPKPRYLEELETYLREELQSLDLTKNNSQELKLQPYREIFEFMIDTFKTYKPLLSAIKNEYEVTLAYQKKIIQSLEPLKAAVTTMSDKCTQQILALQEKEKEKISVLQQEKQHLLKVIDNLKEEKSSLQTQVEHLQASLAEEYTRYLNESHARKLLLAKQNDMYKERQEVTQHKARGRGRYVKGEDVVKLTLALKVARRDLTKAQVKLNDMMADYGDAVPRRDFELLEKKYSDLLQEMKTQQEFLEELQKEHETLVEMHRETEQERDDLSAQLQRVQQNCTPRPDWAKCSEVVPGGAERWDCLAEGKSSEELVDVLLEEIGSGALKEMDVFPGWGKGDDVPVYLRHEGEVENKKLTKKDVVNILKDVWKEKTALEQQTGKGSSLPEFFLSFLQKKYGDAAAMEWSYNLYENMRLSPSNHLLRSFYDTLTGKIDEEQYHSQNQLISNLQKGLAASDSSHSGSLTTQQLRQEADSLREAFPLKKAESIQDLVDVSRYKLDSTEDLINYLLLFEEDEEGNSTPFVAKLRSQYVREKEEYLRQLKNKLGDLREVEADALKTTFCSISHNIDVQALDTCIGQAYQVPGDKADEGAEAVGMVLERLLTGDIRRAGSSGREGNMAGFGGE
ncbi:TXIP1 protein, partial [Turnix velox]|nr:TXIP1 protein [Turnix velox]